MPAAKPFPLNAWYAAAWSHEIRSELAARTICDKDVVLYRGSDGGVVALEDACWHRLLPLSLGRLKGDEVVCGYHGLVFNSAGRCTYMPAQKTINPSAAVRSYPVVERHQMVWIWPGDPALADPDKMPDLLQTFVRLPAGRRQSDGSHTRDIRPRWQHRRRGDHRYALRGFAYGPH